MTTAVALVLPVGAVAVAVRRLQPARVHIDATPSSTSVDATSPSIEARPTSVAAASAGTITVLVVGTDRGVVAGDASGRSDTILLVRLDPAGSRRIVSIPRDLRVIDPRTKGPARINTLVSDRSALVRAVGELLGVQIDHYVETDLPTFAAIGDAIGGVRLSFDGSATDLDAMLTEILPRLTVDDRLSLAEARRLVGVARALRGTTVDWAVVPTSPVQEGGAQMLASTDAAAARDFLVAGRPLPLAEAAPWAATAAGSADQPVLPNADACDR